MTKVKNILVAGIPRSGSTWFAGVLAKAAGTDLLIEPDNEKLWLSAYAAKYRLHRFPYIPPAASCPAYLRLWKCAFRKQPGRIYSAMNWRYTQKQDSIEEHIRRKCGGRNVTKREPASLAAAGLSCAFRKKRRPGTRIVKSVHCVPSLEWMLGSLDFRCVIILRHPANVLASCVELGLEDADRNVLLQKGLRERYLEGVEVPVPGEKDELGRMAVQTAVLYRVISRLEREKRIPVVYHEELCLDTGSAFRSIMQKIGLEWTEGVKAYLAEHDTEGGGFRDYRLRKDLPAKYKRYFSRQDLEKIRGIYETFKCPYYREFYRY